MQIFKNNQYIFRLIVIADDAIYNFWNKIDLNRFRLKSIVRSNENTWWKSKYGSVAINHTIDMIINITEEKPDSNLAKAWRKYHHEVINIKFFYHNLMNDIRIIVN